MKPKSRGYTLIEVIISITIFSVITSIFVFILIEGHDSLHYANQLQDASNLAELYMNEVLSLKRWDELSFRRNSKFGFVPLKQSSIGPDEERRQLYDDIDDYHGFQASRIHVFRNGVSMGENFSLFHVNIQVFYVDINGRIQQRPTHIKQIRVSVQWSNDQFIELNTLRTNV